MAAARRIPITTLSSYSALNNPSESDLPHGAGLHTPPAPSPPAEQTLRIELVLFEPDDTRFAEFRYPQLAEATVNNRREKALNDELKDEDDDDLQKKNSETRKLKTERVAELVDLGYGYDDTDSFIDNSEPVSKNTKECLVK
ncbi:Ubinuclein-1 [Bagarius yarrelli]|uniref:Ubinuclein-1 n=1 Tax=Bagarius yarrelli TaxID=175774 RepID=A0A556VXL8_BAGYA|nr:Ubinuclein-1 [Bagarius yarrelli]